MLSSSGEEGRKDVGPEKGRSDEGEKSGRAAELDCRRIRGARYKINVPNHPSQSVRLNLDSVDCESEIEIEKELANGNINPIQG